MKKLKMAVQCKNMSENGQSIFSKYQQMLYVCIYVCVCALGHRQRFCFHSNDMSFVFVAIYGFISIEMAIKVRIEAAQERQLQEKNSIHSKKKREFNIATV